MTEAQDEDNIDDLLNDIEGEVGNVAPLSDADGEWVAQQMDGIYTRFLLDERSRAHLRAQTVRLAVDLVQQDTPTTFRDFMRHYFDMMRDMPIYKH